MKGIKLVQQTNDQRLIYTIKSTKSKYSIKLKNGLYFSKESRSDEMIKYRENDLKIIFRTLIYLIVFSANTTTDLKLLLNTEKLTFKYGKIKFCMISEFVKIIDKLFGKGFCMVCRKALEQSYFIYKSNWLKNINNVKQPSVYDYLVLNRFFNNCTDKYNEQTFFILNNSKDNSNFIQSNFKDLSKWNR